MKIIKKIKNRIRKIKYKKHLRKNSLAVYENLLNMRINSKTIIDGKTDCEWIVFSKDRAIQLHAFISSYFEKVINPAPINILYTTSNKAHEKSYYDLIDIFNEHQVSFIKETDFKKQLISIIDKIKATKIVFFCDDGMVIEPFDMKDFAKFNPLVCVPSLLRGLDLHINMGAFQISKELPPFISGLIPDENKKVWIWNDSLNLAHWDYPLSVGGHLFSREEMLLLLDLINFSAPNSLEGNLQNYIDIFNKRYGICYNKTQLGTTPANIVNTEFVSNPTTGDLSTEELLSKWNQGFRIKYENYYGKRFEEIIISKFEFVKRT